MSLRRLLLNCVRSGCLAVSVAACSDPPPPTPRILPNLLVILADDAGVDKFSAYGKYPNQPPTPHLDALFERGIRFEQMYVQPVCSPTRATMLTGRHPRRHGIGSIIREPEAVELSLDEVTLAEALPDVYTSAVAGKWHLSSPVSESGAEHPLLQGFDHHHGTLVNLRTSYEDYVKYVDGEVARGPKEYATTDTTDEAIQFIEELPEPWFVVVSYNAPHAPWQKPPGKLHTQRGLKDTRAQLFGAMVEAMDTEIGRLLEGVDRADTTTVFLTDNGTARDVRLPPFDSAESKTTMSDGGVRVPMVFDGAGVSGPAVVDQVAHAVDLFPTLLRLAGRSAGDDIDGLDLAPLLANPGFEPVDRIVYSELFYPNNGLPVLEDLRMVFDGQFKLIDWTESHPKQQLFDLRTRSPVEGPPLAPPLDAEASAARQRLRQELQRLEDTLVYEHPEE